MVDPRQATEFVMQNEDDGTGKITIDAGGMTRFGVAAVYNPGETLVYTLPFAEARERAIEIYLQKYWLRWFNELADQDVANRVLDCYVNPGSHAGTTIAQAAAQACGRQLAADGLWGPATVQAVNDCTPAAYLDAIRRGRKRWYEQRVAARPALYKFLEGWTRRALR